MISSLKNISLACSVLAFGISSVKASSWFDHMEKSQFTEARQKAGLKKASYEQKAAEHATDAKLQGISSYIHQFLPHINEDIVETGITDFFREKQDKWLARDICSAETWQLKKDFTRLVDKDPTLLDSSLTSLLFYACMTNTTLFFQYQATEALKAIKIHGNINDPQHSLVKQSVEDLLQIMNLNKEVLKLQALHKALEQKTKDLLGIEPGHLSKPYKSESVVVVIDNEFKKDLQGHNRPWNIEAQPPFSQWKKGDPLSKALDYRHGDFMAYHASYLSPLSTLHRVYYSDTERDKGVFLNRSSYYNNFTSPVIFNCSFCLTGIYRNLEEKNGDIRWKDNPCDSLKQIQYWKDRLKTAFPNENCEGPLSPNQLTFLKNLSDKMMPGSKQAIEDVQKLAAGLNNDQTHLLVVGPHNSSGSLVKKGFHAGWIKLLDEDETKEHAVVALNYDFTTSSLDDDSHSAGEYKEMTVVVPVKYASCMDSTHPLPYFYFGGHSTATVLLSAVASIVRGHYPDLNHTEIRKAILQGANKNFPGYKEELHGQGMLNLKGALAVAEQLMAARHKN